MQRMSWYGIKKNLALALLACVSMAGLSAQTNGASGHLQLLPQPREIKWSASTPLPNGLRIVATTKNPDDMFTIVDFRGAMKERDIVMDKAGAAIPEVELLRTGSMSAKHLLSSAGLKFDEMMKREGYCILPTRRGLAVIAASSEGLFYGAQSVKQMVVGSGKSATLYQAVIRDWPAMQYRGMDDDLSRGPVPTLEFQKYQVRTFAAFKLNIYSPYFENTLAYKANPLGASPGGAMTTADYVELCRYAAKYHVIVVPQQEAFGHLHNVLSYEQYADLAETPHGAVLAPGAPGSIPLIKQWFSEIAAETPGPFMHIGGDETFDLGKGKTRSEVQRRGLGAVYIEFINQIYQSLQPLHKRILFWGDIALNEPKLVPLLPKDLIAVPWNYDLSPNGYDADILPFKQAGMETWIAPGVNNWNRVYPDSNVALLNIQGFVRDGQRLGSAGVITTAWNDDGEGLFNQDWYGVLFGAAAGWQAGESPIDTYQQSYGQAFHGDSTGDIDEAHRELMLAHALLKTVDDRGASDSLFWVDPWSADGQVIAAKIRPLTHDLRMHAERALVLLAKAKEQQKMREPDAIAAMELGARRMDIIGLKFQLSDEIVDAYGRAYTLKDNAKSPDDVDSALYEISDTNGRCQDLRNAYSLTRDLYEEAWRKENRPFWLHNALARYDLAIDLWTQRGNSFSAALNQWHREHTLPSPGQLTLPPSL